MNYSEAAFFDGVPVAHVAVWQEHQRILALAKACHARGRDRQWNKHKLEGAAGRRTVDTSAQIEAARPQRFGLRSVC